MNDLSILRLIVEATIVVQLVMLMLVGASVYSWSIVFRKRAVLGRAKEDLERFDRDFWSGGDLATLTRRSSRAATPSASTVFSRRASANSRV